MGSFHCTFYTLRNKKQRYSLTKAMTYARGDQNVSTLSRCQAMRKCVSIGSSDCRARPIRLSYDAITDRPTDRHVLLSVCLRIVSRRIRATSLRSVAEWKTETRDRRRRTSGAAVFSSEATPLTRFPDFDFTGQKRTFP